MSKTQPARGMRDFLPADVRKREYVIGIIKEVYQKYGFEPLETPAVENLETLTGKYGEEGSQLMFKILKRGEKLSELTEFGKLQSSEAQSTQNLVNSLSDLALRYDLTVPLARVVANYKDKLPKFFKRYQIQPVWRADRPARGRYREFYQCDVDAIGSSSMIVEAELISAVCEILEKLGFDDFIVQINHRELLFAILEIAEVSAEKHLEVISILDKLDKIGPRGVAVELEDVGIERESWRKLFWFLADLDDENTDLYSKVCSEIKQSFQNLEEANKNDDFKLQEKIISETVKNNSLLIERIAKFTESNDKGKQALSDIRKLVSFLSETRTGMRVVHSVGLARGLSYYTGAIIEIVLTNGDFSGSIAGGGRYDGLIGMFGKEAIPACGLSIGLERILFVMEERKMFEKPIKEGKLKLDSADVLVACFDENLINECLKLANDLRQKDLRVLVYPEAKQKAKPYKYAEEVKVPFVCLIREDLVTENQVLLKNMISGEQEIVAREEVAEKIK